MLRCCYRYAPGRTGNIQKHTAQQASHDVQCHAVQGDTSCLQKVHARCNYTIFLLTSIYNCSYLVGIFVSRTKHKPHHYKYQCRRIRGLGDLDAALKIPSSKKKESRSIPFGAVICLTLMSNAISHCPFRF